MTFLRYLLPLIVATMLIAAGVRRAVFQLREHERLVVFTLGQPVGVRDPGLVVLIPYVQSGVKYDLTNNLDARLIADYEQRFGSARAGR